MKRHLRKVTFHYVNQDLHVTRRSDAGKLTKVQGRAVPQILLQVRYVNEAGNQEEIISIISHTMTQNNLQFEEDFISRIGSDMANHIETAIAKAIIDKLGLQEFEYVEREETDAETGETSTYQEKVHIGFTGAYAKLREAGYVIQHSYSLVDGKPHLSVKFFKEESETQFKIVSDYKFAVEAV